MNELVIELTEISPRDFFGLENTNIDLLKKYFPKLKIVARGNKESQIIGNVIYIDNYGNVISNVTKKLFESVGKGRDFIINARTAKFEKVHSHYSDAINFDLPPEKREEDGKKLALWNSSNYLELAIYKSNPLSVGGASSLFGLEFRDTITINFKSETHNP